MSVANSVAKVRNAEEACRLGFNGQALQRVSAHFRHARSSESEMRRSRDRATSSAVKSVPGII